MNIRFFYKDAPQEIESGTLLDRFHKAPMEYICRTGRTPTHLVLGNSEWAAFHGYVQAMKAMRLTRELHLTPGISEGPILKFCGLTILRSAEESLVMAVEFETRKLDAATMKAAMRCQEFQHRSLHE